MRVPETYSLLVLARIGNMFNAFISYAWRDNEPFPGNDEGWVSIFVDGLRVLLNRELPSAFPQGSIWRDDEQLRGSDHISDTIRDRLHQSWLFVPILSRSWLNSTWCQDELDIFIGLHGPKSGRIFPIWMEPVEGLSELFGKMSKYKFWYEDKNKQSRIRWFPYPNHTDHEYGHILQDLARDMGARLQLLAEEEESLIFPDGQHCVLINGGDNDWELMQAVARHLDEEYGIGYALPPRQDASLNETEMERDLCDKLSVCNNVLFVYDKGPERQVQQHITETLRIIRRSEYPPPLNITLCLPHGRQFGFKPSHMRVFQCSGPRLEDCARQLAQVLA
uniref:TIR domain-containing protein n=1 Tax=Candidatus Kentrum sp. FM TaxID=2126340 RepID=A0A450VWW1_9GAMM|nr:MAG: TIR domain-containing protein [Candidatus Kentron sp. FM]VFJ65449.1 MAG: TIR domain-containing protein [Candidatus Kentron sp. FM]VFK09298.1 MAG: TIR domain-containing protein [Candidatus Kentron sp. FM]